MRAAHGPAAALRSVRAGIEVRRNAKQHNKFYAITARHKPSNQWQWVVWSGSRQATANSMYVNDEISTLSGGNAAWAQKLYRSFLHGFGPIWGDAKSESCKSNGTCK